MLSSPSGVSESIGGAFGSPASTSSSTSSSSWASGSPKPSNPTPLVTFEATCAKESSAAATMLSSPSGASESIGGAFGSPASTSSLASSSSCASGSPKPSNPTPLVTVEATCAKESSPAATMLSSPAGVSESIGGAFGSPASTSSSACSASWASGSPKPSNPTPLVTLEAT